MGNPKASSVAPLNPIMSPRSSDFEPAEFEPENSPYQRADRPRDFHFAVTWVTLFLHLDPIQANGPRPRPASPPSTLALVPVVAAPLAEQRGSQNPRPGWENADRENAAWEMVVPKMVRNESGDFSPAESGRRRLL
jgi:hypothetical protein